MKYKEDFSPALQKAIEEIESQSSIELVPVHFLRAESYSEWGLGWATLVSALLYEIIWINIGEAWLSWAIYLKALSFILIFLGLYFVLRKSNFLSFLIPKRTLMEACSTQASLTFLGEGVFETRDRSGILICVFEFEKKVLVLADKGFRELVKDEYWITLAQKLAKDFDRNKVGDEFFEALGYLKKEIAPHFPKRLDDKNELSDNLIKK